MDSASAEVRGVTGLRLYQILGADRGGAIARLGVTDGAVEAGEIAGLRDSVCAAVGVEVVVKEIDHFGLAPGGADPVRHGLAGARVKVFRDQHDVVGNVLDLFQVLVNGTHDRKVVAEGAELKRVPVRLRGAPNTNDSRHRMGNPLRGFLA